MIANFYYYFIYYFSRKNFLFISILKFYLVFSFCSLSKVNNNVIVEKTIANNGKIEKLFKNLTECKK